MWLFKVIFWCLWRVWFYILVVVPIIIMFPVMFVSILKETWYPLFFKLARLWAKFILFGMGFYYKVEKEQNIISKNSYMFIANHTSMIDIMLMLVIIKNPFVFVGKKELAKLPLFGFFYKRTCILVDRESSKSRVAVYGRAEKRINQGLSICIFPEGRVPEDESIVLDEFKKGAFNIAVDFKLPIVPITFPDNKKRFSYTFLSGNMGRLRAKIHSFLETKNLSHQDKNELKDTARKIIYEQLIKYNTINRQN